MTCFCPLRLTHDVLINFITFPLLYLIIKKYNNNKIKIFFLGWWFGFSYFISSLYWISYSLTFDDIFKPLIPFSIILLPLILGIFTALATFIMYYFKLKENFSSVLIFALVLSLVDYLRGTILTGFPWNLISYSLVNLIEQIQIISFLGGCYLLYLAYRLFSETPETIEARDLKKTNSLALIILGYVTAVSNPKGWAFLVALLPGFVSNDQVLIPQFIIMLAIMLTTEFISMTVYATGGQWLASRLSNNSGMINANRVAASILTIAALWVLSGSVG